MVQTQPFSLLQTAVSAGAALISSFLFPTLRFTTRTWAVLKAAYFISSELWWKSRDYLGLKTWVEIMDENICATDLFFWVADYGIISFTVAVLC